MSFKAALSSVSRGLIPLVALPGWILRLGAAGRHILRARDELGIDAGPGREGLLHVARSLRVDHSAAKALGFSSCWISRGGERKDGQGIGGDYEEMLRKGEVSFQWKFDTIGDFAAEVARQFGD